MQKNVSKMFRTVAMQTVYMPETQLRHVRTFSLQSRFTDSFSARAYRKTLASIPQSLFDIVSVENLPASEGKISNNAQSTQTEDEDEDKEEGDEFEISPLYSLTRVCSRVARGRSYSVNVAEQFEPRVSYAEEPPRPEMLERTTSQVYRTQARERSATSASAPESRQSCFRLQNYSASRPSCSGRGTQFFRGTHKSVDGSMGLHAPEKGPRNQAIGSHESAQPSHEVVEDLLSYDIRNVTRTHDESRREPPPARRSRLCCKRKDFELKYSSRPIPITVEHPLVKVDSRVCRICHDGDEVECLIEPCLCRGTVGNVHARCLKIWLEQSNMSTCELCGYPFAIRQTKKYRRCYSIKVFFTSIVDKRAVLYDVVSFVLISPLTVLGIGMCIRASTLPHYEAGAEEPSRHVGSVTKAGMIMLAVTILTAYGIWLYTLVTYHYKSWKKWYETSYDVEVLPVHLSSEERLAATIVLQEELGRRARRPSSFAYSLLMQGSDGPDQFMFYQREYSAGVR